MTYNVFAYISQMMHFLDLSIDIQNCRELNSLQNGLWLGKNWWSIWNLCLAKVQLTSPKEILIWKLLTFDESWVLLMNYDKPLIKWWMWLQNIYVDQKSWSLTICWPQLTFCSIQLIFNHRGNWLSKLVMQGLKHAWAFLERYEEPWNPFEEL